MRGFSRREWCKLALGGIGSTFILSAASSGAKKINSKFNGVQIGVQSYSFRDRSLDEAIKAMAEAGIGSCELWQGHVEPQNFPSSEAQPREALRNWRLTASLDHFKAVRAKFSRAGIELYAYNLSFRDDFTDPEIERGFEMARALGVKAITASATISVSRRIDRFASRYKIPVGMHNHSAIRSNEFATPDNFAEAMKGASPYIAINLDIGHFTAANFDAVEFLRRHHDRIVTLHIKDRKRDQGANMPFGQGDTPIKQVLALMRENRWRFPANIEYEYKGSDTVEEIKRCLDYCKQALATGS